MYTHDNIKTCTRYSLYLLLNIFIMNAVLFENFYTINVVYKDRINSTIISIIEEFDEIDLQHLCIITTCSEIGFVNNSTYTLQENNILQRESYLKPELSFSGKELSLTNNLNLYMEFPDYQIYIVPNTQLLIDNIFMGYININIILFLIYTFVFFGLEYKLRKRKILDMMSTSNTLREKNMQILTENIHHELNTPVAIIQGNIRKLEIEMQSTLSPIYDCKCNEKFFFDFGQLYSSIEQIDNVLQRMSNFKNLKYSKGNKTLKNIIEYSVNSMNIYKKSNFNIKIDPNLGKYKLDGLLKNGDLLNIVSNHFRNSLEANSSRIVTQVKFNNVTKDLHLYIIDNGVGLRDRTTGLLLSKEKYEDIFKPYYSSKDSSGEFVIRESKGYILDSLHKLANIFKKPTDVNVRGVGLYLNKELLNEKAGDLKLRETSGNGTVFEIIFPAIYIGV
jgi:signal transduction histidine kinase